MSPRSPGTAGLIGASALLLGLALLSWLAIEQHRIVDLPTPANAATPMGAARGSTGVSPTAFGPSAAPTPVAAAARVFQPGDIEVCGFGVVKAGEDEAAAELESRANWQSDRPT